jgi:hypothetical protein
LDRFTLETAGMATGGLVAQITQPILLCPSKQRVKSSIEGVVCVACRLAIGGKWQVIALSNHLVLLSWRDSDEINTWIMVVKIILDDLVELVGGLKRATALLLWASLLVTPFAISQGTASAQSQGDDLASQSKWPEAAAQYSLVVKANPSNGYA